MLELHPVVLDMRKCLVSGARQRKGSPMTRSAIFGIFISAVCIIPSTHAHAQGLGDMLDNAEQETEVENKEIFQDPYEILKMSVAKLKDIRSVRYTSHVVARGANENQMPKIQGAVSLEAAPELPIPFRFLTRGTMEMPQMPEQVKFTASFDGTNVYALDYQENKLLYGDLMTGGADLLAGTTELIRDVFVIPDPFAQEFQAEKLEYIGFAPDVFGMKAYVIKATFSDEHAMRWFIGFDDFLPRRVDQLFDTPDGSFSVRYFIKDLEVNPEFSAQTFTLQAPEGFTSQWYDSSGLLPVGEAAPDWTLQDAQGNSVSLADLKGQIVLMDFWATWCAPCKIAMPGVQKIHEKYADNGVTVLGIQTWDQGKENEAIAYMKVEGFTYNLLLNGDAVSDAYNVTGIPTFYVLGRDGTIIYRLLGAADETVLDEFLHDYLSDENKIHR